ncbi:MAG TPA: patatin-like phospholipase family protein [Gammaproteobacteria bacterium]|nr:patatin-like phospholipase family protein [Gammaproteobacteria bacterium]
MAGMQAKEADVTVWAPGLAVETTMTQFENLVFKGGGAKCIAYAGAIAALEARGTLADVRRIAGTSTGSAAAVLLALGADGAALARIFSATSFSAFEDGSFGFFPNVWRLFTRYGWFKGDAFSQWLRREIAALCGDENLSFAALAERAYDEPQRFRELYVVGTDLSAQRAGVFSFETTPDVPLWLAVRISMSMPLLFAAVDYAGDVWVDGGLSWNYPIEIFDRARYVNGAAGDGNVRVYNPATLGFRVDTRAQITAEREGRYLPAIKVGNFLAYAKAFVNFAIGMANKSHLEPADWHRTVFIDVREVGTTDFSIGAAGIAALIESGRRDTESYFRWFETATGEDAPLNRI